MAASRSEHPPLPEAGDGFRRRSPIGGPGLEVVRYAYLRRVVAPVLRGLGIRFTEAVARRLARGVFEMNGLGRRRAEARLRAAMPDAPASDIAAIGEASYEHWARFWAEALFIPRRLGGRHWRRYVDISPEGELGALAASGRGCILAMAYHGNIAAGTCALGRLFQPIHVVVDRFTQPALAAWQRALYAQPDVQPIDRRDAAATLPRILSDGGAVVMVAEHERRRGRAIETRFLGRTLRGYPTLGRLARWFDVPVAVVTCRREPKPFRFTLALHDVFEPDADEARCFRDVMATLERAVMASPEQYLWSAPTAADSAGDTSSPEALASVIGTGIESGSFRRRRRTASAWRSRSAADKRPADSAAATARAPTA
ncbi:MAG: lysophospholipid acyltransferase family protein [Phycisphaerae bacterium]